MKRIMLTLVLAIAAGVWSLNWASGSQITSLCDEWNVLASNTDCFIDSTTTYPYNEWYQHSLRYYLDADTVINSVRYAKAFCNYEYVGALRESEDASKIYGIPVNHTHEYLIYDWSAQKGDSLPNYWIGDYWPYYCDIIKVYVSEIYNTNPRKIHISILFHRKDIPEDSTRWTIGVSRVIEGVGSVYYGPIIHPSSHCDLKVMCAYKNGEQVYTSTEGKQTGCYFDSRMITELLKGNWKVYKETLSTSSSTTENDETKFVDYDFLYTFTDSTMQMTCPTCYSTPKFYGVKYDLYPEPYEYYDPDTHVELWVKDLFGINQFGYDTITPYSHIRIRNITRNNIEWSYTDFSGNKLTEHYQYLKRYPEELSDTIPLFIKDGPGSSTVEPVDPNLVYATLTKDILSIYTREYTETHFKLYKAPSANHAPAVKRAIKATSFTDSISTTLTESGTYTLELTNPAWDYTIVGTFDYLLPQAVENTPANTPSATKILKDGQLLFLYEGQMYNVQGQQVQ